MKEQTLSSSQVTRLGFGSEERMPWWRSENVRIGDDANDMMLSKAELHCGYSGMAPDCGGREVLGKQDKRTGSVISLIVIELSSISNHNVNHNVTHC